jgi:23S rRNA (cytidine1920-2'-O)/16S rRNA (cytidine1409-2'-O)-methyltransferase
MKRERLDKVLVDRGLAPSRSRAQALILAGVVLVDGQKEDKAGALVSPGCAVRVTWNPLPYVSRGGIKLEAALDTFGLNPAGMVAMDIGASTGGFTDCLLHRGAIRVYSVDVGYGQLAWKLQQDPRVINLQRCNVRYLSRDRIAEPVDLVVVDVSFISLRRVLPVARRFLKAGGVLLALVKPQFEVGRGVVGKGGVVKDVVLHRRVLDGLVDFVTGLGLVVSGSMESPLLGPKGNKEFFLYVTNPDGNNPDTPTGKTDHEHDHGG